MKILDIRIGILFVLFWLAIGAIYYIVIRSHGMTVTSWWRSFWRNTEVGGVKNSLHMVGLSWDVVPVTLANEAKLKSLGLRVVNERDHLHAQLL